jgi:hypothetical protein
MNFGYDNTHEMSELLPLALTQMEVYSLRYIIKKSMCQQSFTDSYSSNVSCITRRICIVWGTIVEIKSVIKFVD